tara:strand:+ start:71 stop:190 length:120 start_codon:yes stop_codon:yes gene_type:complete
MPAIVWSDEYSINVKEMDNLHKKRLQGFIPAALIEERGF